MGTSFYVSLTLGLILSIAEGSQHVFTNAQKEKQKLSSVSSSLEVWEGLGVLSLLDTTYSVLSILWFVCLTIPNVMSFLRIRE